MRSREIVAVKLHRGWERIAHCQGDLINWEERILRLSALLRGLFPTFPLVVFYFENDVTFSFRIFHQGRLFRITFIRLLRSHLFTFVIEVFITHSTLFYFAVTIFRLNRLIYLQSYLCSRFMKLSAQSSLLFVSNKTVRSYLKSTFSLITCGGLHVLHSPCF